MRPSDTLWLRLFPSKHRPVITLKFALPQALLAVAIALASPARCAAEHNDASLAQHTDFLLGNDGGGYSRGIFAASLRLVTPGEDGVAPLRLFATGGNRLGLPKPTVTSALLGPASGAAQARRFVHRLTGSRPPQGRYADLLC